LILHWHAAGLGKWLETSVQMRARSLTYYFAKQRRPQHRPVPLQHRRCREIMPQRVRVVSNGIPDPCPDFRQKVLPRRLARFAAREKLLAAASLDARRPA
jgi:hypothetical protein